MIAALADLQISIVPGRELDARHTHGGWHQVNKRVVWFGQVQVHRIHHLLGRVWTGDRQHTGVYMAHQITAPLIFARPQTAGDNHLAMGRQSLANRVQAFLDRIVNEAAGVDDHQIRAFK